MDSVSSIVLGTPTSPGKGAPAATPGFGDFAALFLQEMGSTQQKPAATKPLTTDKGKTRDEAKPEVDPSQLLAANLQIPVMQAVPVENLKAAQEAPTPALPDKKAEPATALTFEALAQPSLSTERALETKPQQPLAVGDPQPEVKSAESKKKFAVEVHPDAAPAKEIAPKSEKPETVKATTENLAPVNTPAPEKSAIHKSEASKLEVATPYIKPAETKPGHPIESLAASSVQVALKQTLPAQSKIATVAKTTLPNARAFADGKVSAEPNLKANSTPAAPPQPEREESKKHTELACKDTPAMVETKSTGQVNPVAHTASSELTTASPKRSGEATNAPALPKQDLSAQDTSVAGPATVALHSAKLLDSLGRSELRVGMKMGDLGNVEIRTQLHHDQVRAEISVERGDLGHTLAAELPALQQKLRDHDVPIASIVVNHQAAAGSGSFERGSQQQQQATTPMAHVFGVESFHSISSPEETHSTDSALDIHI
jgi:hypothetical protein